MLHLQTAHHPREKLPLDSSHMYVYSVRTVSPEELEPRAMIHRERKRRTMLRGFVRDRAGNRAVRGKRTRSGATCVKAVRRELCASDSVRRG